MKDAKGDNQNGSAIVVQPTYAPASFQRAEVSALYIPDWAMPYRPRIRDVHLSFPAYTGAAPEAAVHRLQVSEPTLVRVSEIESDVGAGEARMHLEIGWRRFGDLGSLVADPGWFDEIVVPWFGPYCYLEEPGEYELALQVTKDAGSGNDVNARLTTFTGLSWNQLNSLLDAGRSHTVREISLPIAAGGEGSPLGTLWPRAKSLTVRNVGANQIRIVIGAGGGVGLITVAAGANFNLAPELLGRNTIVVTSLTGSTALSTIGFW